MFKYTIPHLLKLFTPSVIWEVKTNENFVYLTFDDGPHPLITPWVLSELETYDAKATFFCVGENVSKYKETFEKFLSFKHSVGNHSFNHLNGWKTKNEIYFDNISKCDEEFKSNLFRPPYGKIKFSQINYLKKKYKIIMWSLLSRDYEQNLDIDEALKVLKKNIRKGSIIVFHDSIKSEKNMKKMLPEILKFLHEKKFEMKAL